MSSKKIVLMAVTLALLAMPFGAVSGQQFDKDAAWVPEDANVIAMVRIQDMLDSELGKAEKWRTKQYQSFKSGIAMFPTSADTMLLASEVDLEYMQPQWQVAVYRKKGDAIDMSKVKKNAKDLAIPAQFGSKQGICVRSDAYIVQVASNTLVAMEPANRQATSRWLSKYGAKTQTTISSYLQEAIGYADTSAHFIAAVDMNDAVDPNRIKLKLSKSSTKVENIDTVVSTLASIKGIQLAVVVRDKIYGSIKIDFKLPVDSVEPYAKEFLIKALEENGFMIGDLREWTMKRTAGGLTFSGVLTNEGFNQVSTLITHPLNKGIERAIAPGQGKTGEEQVVETTKAYLDAVKDYMVELSKKKGSSLEYKAKFFEKYAYQIDGLYTSDIDPEALAFGRALADTMREMSTTLRQQEYQRYQKQMEYAVDYEQRANDANANSAYYNTYNNWFTMWNGYAPRYGKYTTERVRDQKRINNFSQKEAKAKLDVLRMDVTKKYTDLKIKLSEKYKTKF